MRPVFITGIDTDIGKTVVATIVTHALKGQYWKPIQCGDLDNSDSLKVSQFLPKESSILHESYRLKTPASPNIAATIEQMPLNLDACHIPLCSKRLVIEGAGGVLVPINNNEFIIDIALKASADVLLVTKNYLGSINHTLLSIEVIRSRGLKIAGIIFNGRREASIEETILNISNIENVFFLAEEASINQKIIEKYSSLWKKGLEHALK